jgi:hypothetical protein
MITRKNFEEWVLDALKAHNGSASVVQVARYVWQKYIPQLQPTDDLFYTWQYDVRWAAYTLRRQKRMKAAKLSPKGIWQIAPAKSAATKA